MRLTRREFCKILGLSAAGIFAQNFFSKRTFSLSNLGYQHEAMFYDKIDGATVRCRLCPNECLLSNGARSFCRVREPHDGKLYTLVYDQVCSAHIDPIEKKPLYHMLPGTTAFSIATAGCNSRCKFCQNWQISQSRPEDTVNENMPVERVVSLASAGNCRTIAFTYSEPIVFYEYSLDIIKAAKKQGIKTAFITGGYINPEPLELLCNYVDAVKIDLKGFDDKFLREVCSQKLSSIQDSLKIVRRKGVWLEIVNLIVPTLNDDIGAISEMAKWIKENLGEDTPLHFSRFFPMYKLKNLYPTPLSKLTDARNAAIKQGLKYVYIGNTEDNTANHTYCPKCGKVIIRRAGYTVLENAIKNSKCGYCGYPIQGLWG